MFWLAIQRAGRQLRLSDWWSFKIPPLLAAAYASILVTRPDPIHALIVLAGLLASITFIAAYGYLINDAFDIDDDRAAGKANVMAERPAWVRIALCAGSGSCAFLSPMLIGGSTVLLMLTAFNLLLPTLYSIPPVRLKNRGMWGVLADAGAARAVPAVSMIVGVAPHHVPLLFLVGTVGSGFLAGLRGIVAHQEQDRDADTSAGVSTLALRIGHQSVRKLILFGILPCEGVFLAIMLLSLLPVAPVVLAATVIWLAVEALKWSRDWTLPLLDKPERSRERYLPLVNNEYYELWLPLALAAQLAIRSNDFILIPVFQLAAFSQNLRVRLRALVPLFAAFKSRNAQSELPFQRRSVAEATTPTRIVVGATYWTVNGVNVFSSNLVRGLNHAGYQAEVLLTEEDSDLISFTEEHLPRPADIPFARLPVKPWEGWGAHWGALIRYLEDRAPCIYIPNSDWRHSCVIPLLPADVLTVGIVHSDDPLHYDHARRMGKYWNGVVAVSEVVRNNTVADNPGLANRIVSIPIGVRVPSEMPIRPEGQHKVLRIIYQGILKQHQKRVLDLPRIVTAALDLGVPVRLSIVGSGPDEQQLRENARELVERGAICFVGVLGNDVIGTVMQEHDVFLLPSEFEGMPNALIEAMAHGCVPVVSRMESGIPELVRDGENGWLARFGDAGDFAQRLQELWSNPDRRHAMSLAAWKTVAFGNYGVDQMVNRYIDYFNRVAADTAQGRFIRPPGELQRVPATVAGISIFPVSMTHQEPGIGWFPAAGDASDFRRARKKAQPTGSKRPRQVAGRLTVIVASPVWTPNGVNSFSEDLLRGLLNAGVSGRLLLTEESTELVQIDGPRLPRPTDIPVDELSVHGTDSWGRRWGSMQRYLEDHAPCVYFPTYDWRHSCIAPRLRGEVYVVGLAHSADSLYLDHLRRLGECFNSIVTTDRTLRALVSSEIPRLAHLMTTIPVGAQLMPEYSRANRGPSPLRVLITSMGACEGPLPLNPDTLARLAAERGQPIEITCLSKRFDPAGNAQIRWLGEPSRYEWLRLCDTHDVLITCLQSPSYSEGLREAMGHGCIPILAGGSLSDQVENERSGFCIPQLSPADISANVIDILFRLSASPPLLRRTSLSAWSRAVRGARLNSVMIGEYLELFSRLQEESASGRYRRQPGAIQPLPDYVDGIGVFPVATDHIVPKIGAFPSVTDYLAYLDEIGKPLI